MPGKDPENGAHDLAWIDRGIIFERFFDVLEKVLLMAFFMRLAPECPAFVIQTADQALAVGLRAARLSPR